MLEYVHIQLDVVTLFHAAAELIVRSRQAPPGKFDAYPYFADEPIHLLFAIYA